MTFKEMTRIIKKNGYIYVNVPSSGPYHKYPGDNLRFYTDAGQALAYWLCFKIDNISYPCTVIEAFNINYEPWNDYVCVWQRTDENITDILLNNNIIKNIGLLKKKINKSKNI
jgi:hypothetical protein